MHHIENALPGDREAKACSHEPLICGSFCIFAAKSIIVDKQDTDMTRFCAIINTDIKCTGGDDVRSDIYSLLVSGMRYFFVAAIVYILFRIVYHSVCEYNELRRVKNWLEKGYARHIEFLPPFDTNEEGFILAKSNIIGRGRKCDICIDDGSVRRKHAKIYEKGGFVYIRRYGRANILINGEPMEHKTEELAEGDLVQLGEVKFYYRMKRVRCEEVENEQG